MNLKNIRHPKKSYLFGKVSSLQLASENLGRLIHNFQETPVSLPAPINRLGMIRFTGEISGFIDQLVAFGKLSSNIGSLEMDLLVGQQKEHRSATYLKGKIASSELDIALEHRSCELAFVEIRDHAQRDRKSVGRERV